MQEQIYVIDPENGEAIYSPDKIKEVSLKYCINVLKKKEPDEKYSTVVNDKKEIHKLRMLEKHQNDCEEIPYEMFMKAFEKIKSKPGKKYEFFKKAGSSLLLAVYNLFVRCGGLKKFPPNGWNQQSYN